VLLLKYLQLRARLGWSLSNLAALLRQQLFVYRMFNWIDQPFQPPPLLAPAAEQIPLSWSTNLDCRKANLNRKTMPSTQNAAVLFIIAPRFGLI
jgi:hypothetical protein